MINLIDSFFSNPLVGAITTIISFVASVIAIHQYIQKDKALKEVSELKVEISRLISNGDNSVRQGDQSQFFNNNSGAVSIDNR